MLEGISVENTPADLIRQVEAWVEMYPEERRSVANVLADTASRLREPGPTLKPLTWAMVGEPEPRSWLVDQWLPAGSVALLTGEGGAGKSRLALATGTRFSRGTAHRRKRHISPRCGVGPAASRLQRRQNTGELLPADVAGIGMRHDYPSPDHSRNLTYFRDRRQVLSTALRIRRGLGN